MRRKATGPGFGIAHAEIGRARTLTFGGVVGLLGLVALLFLATPALAADTTYLGIGSFSSEGTGDGEMTHPRRSAVEASTGNVLVVDRDNHRVQVFSPTGAAADYLAQFGAGTLEAPFGLAIDQSNGDVYVSDPAKDQIFKFESDGAPTPTYTLDGTFTSPAKGAGAGQIGDFEADLAVDPTSGDLLVADPGNNRVSRYGSNGAFDSSFTGADSPDGAFTGLLDLDVAANGDVYVVDSTGPVFVADGEVGPNGTCTMNAYCDAYPSRVLRFSSAGAYQSAVEPLQSEAAGLVTVDPANSQVIVGRINPQGLKARTYAAGGARQIEIFLLPNIYAAFPSMAAGSDRLYVVNDLAPNLSMYSGAKVEVLDAVELPDATIDPAGTVSASSVQLAGTVNPHGISTAWRFEYRPVGASAWRTGPSGDAGEGNAPVPVTGEVTGLEPSLEYEARLVAGIGGPERNEKEVASDPVGFTTTTIGPLAHTWFTAPRTADTARVNGYVNPRNDATTYHFEWGPTGAYGNVTPTLGAGSGGAQVLVAANLTDLQPNTTYHYRLIAENSVGSVTGDDRTFTTRTAAEMQPPRRGIELVTPADKGNQNPQGYLASIGGGVVWGTMSGAPGSAMGHHASFLAQRTPQGWVSRSLMPKAEDLIGGGELGYDMIASSTDYSKPVWIAGEDGGRGPGGDPFTLARFELASEQQTTLASFPAGGLEFNSDSIVYASDDASHVYVEAKEPVEGSVNQVYDVGDGPKRLVSVLPQTGEAPICGVDLGERVNLLSAQGGRFYFTSSGNECSEPLQIYLRDDHGTRDESDDSSTLVSTPAVDGPESESIVSRVNASGDSVVYQTAARKTADDTNESPDLYRWTIGKGTECITCFLPEGTLRLTPYKYFENLAISDDLSRVYLNTDRELTPGLGRGLQASLYRVDQGQAQYLSAGITGQGEFSELTSDGRVLIFKSPQPGITADPNGGKEQLYRYSEADGAVECLSCPPPGGQAFIPEEVDVPRLMARTPVNATARALTDDGNTYLFNTQTALLPSDANNNLDIYEWHNGTISLVTDGESELGGLLLAVPLKLVGVSGDGTDALFRVSARLTGFEHDAVGQLFDARIGGGFTVPNPPASCREDACQGSLDGAPSFSQPGSADLVGPGNEAVKRAKPKRCAKPKRKGPKRQLAATPRRAKAKCGRSKAGQKRKGNRSGNGNGKGGSK